MNFKGGEVLDLNYVCWIEDTAVWTDTGGHCVGWPCRNTDVKKSQILAWKRKLVMQEMGVNYNDDLQVYNSYLVKS